MYRDEQTHQLPADAARRASLVTAMRAADWAALKAETDAWRELVAGHFEALMLAGGASAPPAAGGLDAAFSGLAAPAEPSAALGQLRIAASAGIAAQLVPLQGSSYYPPLAEARPTRLPL